MKKFNFILVFVVFLNFSFFSLEASSLNGELKIELSGDSIKQGETLTVFASSPRRLKQIELTFLGKKTPLFRVWNKKQDHLFRGFLGIPVYAKTGKRKLVVSGIDMKGQKVSGIIFLKIRSSRFKVQHIKLSKKKTRLLNYKILQKESRILGKLLKKRSPKVYFASNFVTPVKGRISSEFGLRRKYNGGEISSHHKGLDIANRTGTPIYAANGGHVVLAIRWKSHGKSVLIDHGHGIFTIYIHMHRIHVKKGQWVKKGALIGRVGSTGIATGPHLHFGLSVNDVRVDPLPWLQGKVKLHFN